MHYYQHHIGDFIRDTSRLSDQQAMAYLRMLWLYYESESPLSDVASLAFKLGVEQGLVLSILSAFFKPDGEVWRHTRCDQEIAEYKAICERNKTNGGLGGRPRKTQSVSSGNPLGIVTEPNGSPADTGTEPGRNPNHKPVTSNHEPLEKPVSASADMPATPATCPQLEIVRLYNTVLASQGLTAVKESLWGSQRQKSLMARWREDKKRQSLDWWQGWFEYIARSDFLMGRTCPKPFYADLDWLLAPRNFCKVLEGKYHA